MHKALALALVFLAGPALAHGKRDHSGLLLRLTGGLAAMGMEADEADTTIEGPAVSLSVALGGAVVRNLILYGEGFLLGTDATDDDIRIGYGERVKGAAVGGFGPGICYYFMPVNLYVGASFVMAGGMVRTEGSDGGELERETELGFGLSLSVGKEWWASDNWAVGVAGRVFGARLEDENITRDGSIWRVGALSLLFSATYN